MLNSYENKIREKKEHWESALNETPQRKKQFVSDSGIEIKDTYTPLDLDELGFDYEMDLGLPGQYPFTRGNDPLMYRKGFWVRSQFSGFGDPQDTNRRYKYILEQGQSALSIALDLPTQSGYDADHPLAHGEVGKCGVSVCSLKDMEELLDGIPLEKVEELSSSVKVVSMIITAMYVCLAKKQGIDPNSIRVRVQTDGLKDFIATGNFVFPPKAALRIITDMIEYCVENMPNWIPISLCGYHIREAGADAVQEVAFTLSNGIAYIKALLERGLKIDDFAPRFNIFLTSHMDFFEEISKIRAARRLWARLLKERFGAKDPASCTIRLICYTAGSPLTSQQPLNNVMRVTMEALAAILGGAEVLFCSSYDETYCLPSEEAMKLAMMTQQIIAYETGLTNTVDPVGGSYYIESLTKQIEEKALEYIAKVDEMGGSIKAIESGYFRKEIARAAYSRQMEIENNEKVVVGVNSFITEDEGEEEIQLFRVDPEAEKRQVEKVRQLRKERDNEKVMHALERLKIAAREDDNLYPHVQKAVACYATVGEICDALREIFGQYDENTYYL